jgi:hypothetical protein
MWPCKELEVGSLLYRDFLPHISEQQFRSARLTVWYDTPHDFFFAENAKLKHLAATHALTLPKLAEQSLVPKEAEEGKDGTKAKLKVFSDLPLIKDHLHSPLFEIVDKPEEADVLWMNQDIFAQFAKTYQVRYLLEESK